MRRWESGTVSNHSRALVPVFAPGTSRPNCDYRKKQGSLGRARGGRAKGAGRKTNCGTCWRAHPRKCLGRPARRLRGALRPRVGARFQVVPLPIFVPELGEHEAKVGGVSRWSSGRVLLGATVTAASEPATAATTKRATVPASMLTSPMGCSTQHGCCAGSEQGRRSVIDDETVAAEATRPAGSSAA